MGIVFKQSIKNTFTIYLAFAIGGTNALFLYTSFLTEEYYGLVTYLLSCANLLMPLTAFGVHYSLLKFYSSYTEKAEKDRFLSFALFLPLLIAIPLGMLGNLFYESIATFLSLKNPIVKQYTFVIYLVALATAYFEVFHAWAKVQLQSVYGTVLRELFSRVSVLFLLIFVALNWISAGDFIYYLTGMYFVRTLLMAWYAFRLYRPKFSLRLPHNTRDILRFSLYIILAGSAGSILIDIDKFMIPQKEAIANAAYYAVAVYIATLVETPGRAMSQILQPLVAKALNENRLEEVQNLYQRSSLNLLWISGLVFLGIHLNLNQLYTLIPQKYSGGAWVVLLVSLAKLYNMFLGANGAIISNSKYYKILLPYGLAMAISVYFLNDILIDKMSINGAALSTFLVVFVANSLKMYYVHRKFQMLPSTSKTGALLMLLIACYFLFCFWDFPFHPLLNIFCKSSLFLVFYLVISWKLKISEEVNAVFDRLARKFY